MIELRRAPGYEDVLAVTRRLRDRDAAECFATQWPGREAEMLAHAVISSGEYRWGVYRGGRPIAHIGASPCWPGVWTAWACGTDEWPRAALTLTRHVRRTMLPGLYRAGARRVHCMALAAHTDARAWLEANGAKQEFFLDNYGRNGEMFVSYAWTREQVRPLITGAAASETQGHRVSPAAPAET